MRSSGQGESSRRTSKFLALILRHDPGAAKIRLDAEGWAEVEHVLAALTKRFGTFDRTRLEEVVQTNDKSRYAFNSTGDKIRANQGHSVPVNLGLPAVEPPPVLYHGTVARFLEPILEQGLNKGKRHHVHLSPDIPTALNVGGRRSGETVVLEVQSGKMEGHSFFRSANNAWLTDHVPPGFLRVLPLSTPPR